MSAVQSIPPELLQEIFILAISDRTRVPGSRTPIPYSCHPTYGSSTSPYAISHVCKRWRDISINFPDLWTYLSIGNPKSHQLLHLIKEWIHRSRSLPLHLSLHEFKSHTSQRHPEITKAVFSVFLQSLHRCKTFALDIRTLLEDLTGPDHNAIQYPVSLDCISLRVRSSPTSALFFSNLIRTSTLLFVWISGPSMPKDVGPSWGNLQHLSLHNAVDQLPQILPYCKRIKTLEVHSWSLGTTPCAITLPHLERLSLTCVTPAAFLFLKLLQVPALSELVLDCHMPIQEFYIVQMLKNSKATLKSLEINSIARDLGVGTLITESCLTELETLRLSDTPGLSDITDSGRSSVVWPHIVTLLLTRKSDTWQYLPHLRHFSLSTQNTDDIITDHLEVMVQSRLSESDPDIIQKHRSLVVSSGSVDFSFNIPPK